MQDNQLIVVKARITLKATKEGGRRTGIASGYRPDHVFDEPVDGEMLRAFMGDIRFSHQELIQPGESSIVTVRFLKRAAIEPCMQPGRRWLINEGGKTVAFGEILEVEHGV